MAVYKVPQDVEAEDKLLGPLTFKQFIFLLIASGAALFAWLLFNIHPFLVVLPLPVILIFGGLAVFRREDQPVERYLLSFFNFLLRPRVRIWSTEGHYEHLIITAPKKKAPPPLKRDVNEVHGQLEKLAQIVDTRGWALKRPELVTPGGGVSSGESEDRLFVPDAPQEPQEIHEREDIMDENNPEVMQLDSMLKQVSTEQRQQLLQKVQQEASAAPTAPEDVHYDPYGASMSHQKRINPDGTSNIKHHEEEHSPQPQPQAAPQAPQQPQPTYDSSDIMNLSSELKVSQIADKVNRDNDQKLQEGEEIQLR